MIDLFEYLINILENLSIEYMVSGSMALNNYATPRMTRDIDIVIHLRHEEIDTFIKRFGERFYLNPDTIREETLKNGVFNIIDNETGYKIDFIVRKDTEYRKIEFSRKIRTNISGIETWIVSIEDLILSKLIWTQKFQSDRQLDDLKSLLENKTIDYPYLDTWIKKMKLKTFNLGI